jgi:hypothetical protein
MRPPVLTDVISPSRNLGCEISGDVKNGASCDVLKAGGS